MNVSDKLIFKRNFFSPLHNSQSKKNGYQAFFETIDLDLAFTLII